MTTALDTFAGKSLSIHYRLGLQFDWCLDGYENWDDMIGEKAADVAHAMLAEKQKASPEPGLTRLDFLAMDVMEQVLENTYAIDATYDGYDSWEQMIARQSYELAAHTLKHLDAKKAQPKG